MILFGLQIRRKDRVDCVVVTLGVTVRTSRPRQPAKCLPEVKQGLDVEAEPAEERVA